MTTDELTFSASEISLHWQDQYVSNGVNKSMAAAGHRGVHRGFVLMPGNGDPQSVQIVSDVSLQDHAALCFVNGGMHGISVRKAGGDFPLDLSAWSNKTVVIAIVAKYQVSSATTAVIRVYQLSPVDEFTSHVDQGSMVVLGVVNVPGPGLSITSSMISGRLRMDAWQNHGAGDRKPRNLIRNGFFYMADGGSNSYENSIVDWTSNGASGRLWTTSNSNPFLGPGNIWVQTFGTNPTTAYLRQRIDELIPYNFQDALDGNGVDIRIRLRVKVRVVNALTSGTLGLRVYFGQTGGGGESYLEYAISASAADPSSGRQIDTYLIYNLAGATTVISRVELFLENGRTAGGGVVAEVSDLELWHESFSEQRINEVVDIREKTTSMLGLMSNPGSTPGATGTATSLVRDWTTELAASLMMMIDTTPAAGSLPAEVYAMRRDRDPNSNYLHPSLNWLGRIKAGKYAKSFLARLKTYIGPDGNDPTKCPLTLVWEHTLATPFVGSEANSNMVRLYSDNNDGTLIFTINAKALDQQPLAWNRTGTGFYAMKCVLLGGNYGTMQSMGVYTKNSTGTTWADTDWNEVLSEPGSLYLGVDRSNNAINSTRAVYEFNTTSSAGSMSLPAASDVRSKNRTFIVKDTGSNASVNNITVTPNGTDRIEGLNQPYVMDADNQCTWFFCDGVEWWILN